MMPLGVDTVQVSLSDALQVIGKPLNEEETWSVLSKSTESIQDIFLKGQALADDGPSFVVSPYTLLLCVDGRVFFTESIDTSVPDLRRFIPPEGLAGIDHFTELVVEKMYIYALGQTLRWCSEYGISVVESFGHKLQSLITAMCNEHPDHRSSLVHVLEACALHAHSTINAIPYGWHISRLNRIILGSDSKLDKIGQDEDQFYINSNGNNSRGAMDDHRYFHKGTPPVFQFGKPPPVPNLSSQEHPDSRPGPAIQDEPNHASRDPPRNRKISHHSTRTGDSRKDIRDPHRRSYQRHHSSFSSEDDDDNDDDEHDDDGRSYHLSDIVSSPSIPVPQSPRRQPHRSLLHERSHSHSRSRSRGRGESSYHMSDILSPPSMPEGPRRPARRSLLLREEPRNGSRSRSRNRSRSRSRTPRRRGSRSRDRSRSRSRTPTGRRLGPSPLERTTSHVYERLRERREKLSVLREQLRTKRHDPPPAVRVGDSRLSDEESVQSDIDDIKRNIRELRRKGRSQKSLMSMESAQEGSYHPEQITPAASMPSIPNRLQQESRRHSRQHSPPDLRRSDPSWSPGRDGRQRWGDSHLERERRLPARKLKKFFGPEFVVMSGSSGETIDMAPSVMCKMGKVSPDRKQVVVMLLNGKRLELMCDLGTSGKDLLETVVAYLQLVEKSYFGLAYIKDGEYMFLDPDSKIYKVGPEPWRSEVKRGVARSSSMSREKLTLFFRVKFYVDNVNIMKNLEDTARHSFYLQLRRDVLEERVKCKDPEGLHLGSLALQAEMGAYDHEKMAQNYFLPEHYVPAGIVKSMGVAAIRRKLPVLHQEHEDMTEEEAEFEFLMEARKLSEYGIHFHRVSKAKKSSKESVWLGICARGIIVYDRNGSRRSEIFAHPWPNTKKVAFKRKKFIVEPNDSNGFKFVHYTDNYKKGNYLLQLCKAQHRFHMTMRNKAQISQKFQEDYPSPLKYDTPEREADFGHDVHFSDDESGGDNYGDDYPEESFSRMPDGSNYPINQSEPALNVIRSDRPSYLRRQSERERGGGTTLPNRREVPQRSNLSKARSVDTGRRFLDDDTDDPLLGSSGRPLKNHARQEDYDSLTERDYSSNEEGLGDEPYRSRSDWSEARSRRRGLSPTLMEERTVREADPPYATIDSIRNRKRVSEKQNSSRRRRGRPQTFDDDPYVVDTSIHTKDESYHPEPEAFSPLSDTLLDRLSDLPSPVVPERDIVIVTLKKDSQMGLGLTIVGGENSGSLDLGIFVREVVARGPADRDGRIFPGDRIISINGQSLEGVSHRIAVDIIQRAPETVQLILSQPRRNKSSPRAGALPEAPYANSDLMRSHSFSVAPKAPLDRKAQRSNSTVTTNHSRQTPPTKPRRNPQSFGSSYSLVISDSDGLLSETEIRRIEEQQSFLLGARDLPRGQVDHLGGGDVMVQSPPPKMVSDWNDPVSTTLGDSLGGAPKADQELHEPAKPVGPSSNPSGETSSAVSVDPRRRDQGLVVPISTDAAGNREGLAAQDENVSPNVSRGYSPTFEMDFDDDFSDEVPTPESSEMEDLFGDEKREKKFDLTLGRNPLKKPQLSALEDESHEVLVMGQGNTNSGSRRSTTKHLGGGSEVMIFESDKGEKEFDVNLRKSLEDSALSAPEAEKSEPVIEQEKGNPGLERTTGNSGGGSGAEEWGSYDREEKNCNANLSKAVEETMMSAPGNGGEPRNDGRGGDGSGSVRETKNLEGNSGAVMLESDEEEFDMALRESLRQSLLSAPENADSESVGSEGGEDISELDGTTANAGVDGGGKVEHDRQLAEGTQPSQEALLDEGTSVDGEFIATYPKADSFFNSGKVIPEEGEQENVTESQTLLNENTRRFSPPPDERKREVAVDNARNLPSTIIPTRDTPRNVGDRSPSPRTREAVLPLETSEDIPDGDQGTSIRISVNTPEHDHASEVHKDPHQPLSSGEESPIETTSEESSDDEVNDYFADVASPALSTREADTLTPTHHLVTPTRGLLSRGQARAPSNPRLHRKSIDDDERCSSAISGMTANAKSTSPSSFQLEESDRVKSGAGSLNPSGVESQESDAEYGTSVRGGAFDSSQRALEIEPSILPVMEEELAADDRKDRDSLELLGKEDDTKKAAAPPSDGTSRVPNIGASLQEAATVADVISEDESSEDGEPTKIPNLPYVTPGNCFEVELRKGTEGLGLSVQGGVGAHKDPRLCTVRIKKMFPGQAAARSGLVEEGDVILAVNGEHIHDVPHAGVVTRLRTAPQVVRLLICRPSQEELNSLLKSTKRMTLTEEGSPIKVVQPPKGDISVAPASLPSPPPSAREKSDTIALNTSLDADISKIHSLTESLLKPPGKTEDYIEVTLMKPVRGGLGFTVAGGVNTGGCYIKDIITDPALADGRLKKGDKIISVNSKNMANMNHFEAVTFLRMTPREVTIRVKRPVNRYSLPAPEKASAPAESKTHGGNDETGKSGKGAQSVRDEPEVLGMQKRSSVDGGKQVELSNSSAGVLSDNPVNVLPLEPFRGGSGWPSSLRGSDEGRAAGVINPRRIDDSDIDLGDLTGEDSDWEDLSSGTGSGSDGELDEILAVLEPMHSRGAEGEPTRPSERGVETGPTSREGPPKQMDDSGDRTMEDKEEVSMGPGHETDIAKNGDTGSNGEEPPPIPDAPPPPLTPTSDRSVTSPPSSPYESEEVNPTANQASNISKDSEESILDPGKSKDRTNKMEQDVSRTPGYSDGPTEVAVGSGVISDTEGRGEVHAGNKDRPVRRVVKQEPSFEEEEDVDDIILNRILNQEDSFDDDITFADMLSSGSEAEEEEEAKDQSLGNTEMDIIDRPTKNLERPLECELAFDFRADKNEATQLSGRMTHTDDPFKDLAKVTPTDEKKVLSPSPVVVTPPMGRLALSPSRNSSSASDRSSPALPSIKEDAPLQPGGESTFEERREDQGKKEAEQSLLSDEEKSLGGRSLGLDDSEDHTFSDFSFSDAQLPMPSSPSPSPPPKASTDHSGTNTTGGDAPPPLPDSPPPLSPDLPPPSLRRDKEPNSTRGVVIPFPKERGAGDSWEPKNENPGGRGGMGGGDHRRSREEEGPRLSFTPRSARQVLSIQRDTLFDSEGPSLQSPRTTVEGLRTSDGESDPSPRSVLSVKSPETAVGEVTPENVKPAPIVSEQSLPKDQSGTAPQGGQRRGPQSDKHNHSEDELLAAEETDQVPSRVVSLMRRPPSTGSEASESGVYRVDVIKPPTGGLGLSLVGAVRGGMTSVSVKSVTPGGVTDQDGRIQVGDKVLQVNGQSTVGMTQSKVVSLLRKAQGTVRLTLACVKAPPRPASMVIQTDRGSDIRPPTVPPLDLSPDLGQSEPGHSGRGHPALDRLEDELSQTESCSESPRQGGSRTGIPPHHHLTENDQSFTTGKHDPSPIGAPILNLKTFGSVSLLTPPLDFAGSGELTDRDTDSDIESAADLPGDESLLGLLDDGGGDVAMEMAIRATRQIGRALKDKIQGKDDVSFGSDIGFPLTSEDEFSMDSDWSKRSHEGPRTSGDGPLLGLEVLRVPKTCKLYLGKSLKSTISGLEKKIEKLTTEDEFKSLRQLKVVDVCTVAKQPENRDKNRFRNVLPYDKTRVVLQRAGNSDYINASHVRVMVAGTEHRYLVCQGPLPQTCTDFWAMIWEQGVEVIAMVTLSVENGKVKCHKYWPEDKDSPMSMGDLEILLEDVQRFDHFVIRKLAVTDVMSKEVHRVTHLNFISWPDHSVPHSAVPLLRFARYMHKINTGSGPIAINCSAGIGRSGTLITIDLLLPMIEAGQEGDGKPDNIMTLVTYTKPIKVRHIKFKFNILELVKELRLQRQGMVQTKDQYTFCYQAAVEALKVLP